MSQKLEKGPIPLYYQLESQLRAKISNRDIKPQELLPTEMELCETYGVSRATVRQAIKALEDDGLIKREQGRGTTVLAPHERRRNIKLFGSIDDFLRLGGDTELKFESRRLVNASDELIKDGNLVPNEKVYLFKARRYLKMPKPFFAMVYLYLPRNYGELFTLNKINGSGALIRKVEDAAKESTHRIQQSIRAISADEKIASELEILPGTPVMKIKRVYLTKEDKLLECASSYIAEPQYEYRTELVMSSK